MRISQSIKLGLLDLFNGYLWKKVMMLSVIFVCAYCFVVFYAASPTLAVLSSWLLKLDWLHHIIEVLPFSQWLMSILGWLLYLWACVMILGICVSAMLGWLMMPWVLQVIESRYKLEKKGDTPLIVELKFSLFTACKYFFLMVCSLPALLIPVINIVLPFIWLVWYLSKTMRFDALVVHASRQEYEQLCATYNVQWFKLGLICALFSVIPVLGQLLLMVLTPLCFGHFALLGLQKLRSLS